jgi:hypothetical protein
MRELHAIQRGFHAKLTVAADVRRLILRPATLNFPTDGAGGKGTKSNAAGSKSPVKNHINEANLNIDAPLS